MNRRLPTRTPDDSISLPPGVDFRDPERLWIIEADRRQIVLRMVRDDAFWELLGENNKVLRDLSRVHQR